MKLAKLLCVPVFVWAFSSLLFAQSAPNLENGFKNYGIGIRIGTVQFSPRYMDMGPPPTPEVFNTPHTNSLHAVWAYNDYVKIIFNDGWI